MKNTQKLVPIAELTPVAKMKLMEVPKERNAADSCQWIDVSASSIGCTRRGELLTIAFPPVLVAPPDEPSLVLGLFREPLMDEKLSPIINDSLLLTRERGVHQPIEG